MPRSKTELDALLAATIKNGQDYVQLHHRNRIGRRQETKEPRIEATDGEMVAKYLLGLIEQHPEDPKWQMFSEIVTRCASDVAGNMHASNEHKKKYNTFDDIFKYFADEIKAKGHLGESIWRNVLNYIPLYQKGFVQTPHPTETLNREAISAEGALHHAIEESQLFKHVSKGRISINGEEAGGLRDHLQTLYDQIEPVTASMSIPHEIRRSIEFSELAFNAIPHMMQGVIDPAVRHGLRNTQPLTSEELRHFGRLVEASTWSPGDRDSKPEMSTEMLHYGIRENQTAMALQYAVKIAEILEGPAEMPPVSTRQGIGEAQTRLKTILSKILASIPESARPQFNAPKESDKGNGEEDKKGTTGDKFLDHYAKNGNGGHKVHKKTVINRIRVASHPSEQVTPFASSEEMIKALDEVRQIKGAAFPKFNGNQTDSQMQVLSQMDVLVAQMHSFGNYALRSQIRQNAEMHEEVMGEILKMPELAALLPAGDRKKSVETLLDILHDPARKQDADRIRSAIHHYLETSKPAANTPGNNVYETLAGMQFAAQNPEAIPQYLIAECRDGTDILEAFALLKLMEPDGMKKHVEIVPLLEHRKPVESSLTLLRDAYTNKHFAAHHAAISHSSPSLLHEKHLLATVDSQHNKQSPEQLAERKRHIKEEIEQAEKEKNDKGLSDEWLKQRRLEIRKAHTLSPEAEYERLTVADVKRAYSIELKPGDDKKEINHTKMVMFAGSDIMKSAGPAGAALTQRTIEDLRKDMLEWDTPVLLIDYIGSGGGVHRSQPVATSFETTQGRSMRQTANSIAQKAILTMGRFIRRMMGFTGTAQSLDETTGGTVSINDEGMIPKEKSKLGLLAQLNLGNLAGFPTKQLFKDKPPRDYWTESTKDRCNVCMDEYQKGLYHTPEFACLMAFSADKFVKLTSYAARSASRVGDAKADSVETLRAIGYGAALNVSGSCASLYYGVSKFMHADAILNGDKKELENLLELYLRDPKVQDVINRATFGIAMSDMATAWKYLDLKDEYGFEAPGHKGYVETMKKGPDNAGLRASYENAMGGLKDDENKGIEQKTAWVKSLNPLEQNDMARHAMAKIDDEYQKVSQVLLKLHSLARGKPEPKADMVHIHEQITELLPVALKSQIKTSREHIKDARESLAERFKEFWKNPDDILRGNVNMVRSTKEVFNPIYYRMGACFECFENVPRAYTRPYYAQAMETSQQHGISL